MIVAPDTFTVITVYRNRQALKAIRRKSKRCIRHSRLSRMLRFLRNRNPEARQLNNKSPP